MYLYSNILGTFVFNQNFQIREKILFSDAETIKYFVLLADDKGLPSEEKFLKKFKSITNLREKCDEKQLENVDSAMKGFRKEFYEKNILLTKHQIKDSVADDLLIIQCSDCINEIEKSINILAKRLREWYLSVLPELENKIEDHKHLAELALKERSSLVKEFKIKNSMGKELGKEDTKAIESLASAVLDLFKQKEQKQKYLEAIMKKTCPNLTAVAGYSIGAELLSHAGSLKNMVMMPASTIQLLGAEKALFRHMINKNARPPKHGLIFQHELLQKAKKDMRGKVARTMADKIGLAVKVDYFKGDFIGDKLRKELEEKFR
ncbi:hypothetical protein JXC34_01920 [Candidatus Woesearchaeota archaeon]|nr:hypothetical protein [Candidatus Woesearchaeota archaeon]